MTSRPDGNRLDREAFSGAAGTAAFAVGRGLERREQRN